MPDPAELRRQILAYKQQVHELRLQYAKELEAKANKTDERKKAAASVSARGIYVLLNISADGSCGPAAIVLIRTMSSFLRHVSVALFYIPRCP